MDILPGNIVTAKDEFALLEEDEEKEIYWAGGSQNAAHQAAEHRLEPGEEENLYFRHGRKVHGYTATVSDSGEVDIEYLGDSSIEFYRNLL